MGLLHLVEAEAAIGGADGAIIACGHVAQISAYRAGGGFVLTAASLFHSRDHACHAVATLPATGGQALPNGPEAARPRRSQLS